MEQTDLYEILTKLKADTDTVESTFAYYYTLYRIEHNWKKCGEDYKEEDCPHERNWQISHELALRQATFCRNIMTDATAGSLGKEEQAALEKEGLLAEYNVKGYPYELWEAWDPKALPNKIEVPGLMPMLLDTFTINFKAEVYNKNFKGWDDCLLILNPNRNHYTVDKSCSDVETSYLLVMEGAQPKPIEMPALKMPSWLERILSKMTYVKQEDLVSA